MVAIERRHSIVIALWLMQRSLAADAAPPPSTDPPSATAAVADALFEEAKRLMEQHDYDAACIKFGESQRIEPGSGTLLGLAWCHESQGKLASAWIEYKEVILAARRAGRGDRVALAEERVRALEPRLSYVELVRSADHPLPSNTTLVLDGLEFGTAAIGVRTPLDPGLHELRASAPGFQPWHATVKISAEGELHQVAVPDLVPEPTPSDRGEPGPSRDRTQRRPPPLDAALYAVGAVTFGTIVASATTGGLAWAANRDLAAANEQAGNPATNPPDNTEASRKNLYERAESLRLASTVLTGVAVAGGATLVALLVVRQKRRHRPHVAYLAPVLARHHVGVSFRTQFGIRSRSR